MANFLYNGPCQKCGSRDNRAHYDDGSEWCWGCQTYTPRTHIPQSKEIDNELSVQLDADLCTDFPRHVVSWLGQYGITVEEGLRHGWRYSPKRDQLVFIFRDEEGRVAVTQARNFWPFAPLKYFTQGPTQSILPIFSEAKRELRICIVEDVVSAAKIARQCDAMPCLGSTLSLSKQARLRALGYQQMVLWLDSDKLGNAMRISSQARLLGFETKVVYTPLDPKEYDDGEITRRLENSA